MKRTFFTEEKLGNIKRNIENFDWARNQKEDIIKEAEMYLSLGTENLMLTIPPQEIFRSFAVNQKHGCPNCGTEMLTHGRWGWEIDYINNPWKLKCPNCGKVYPSNDFGKFYESGLDEHGLFSYSRADRSLLINELYPEMGDGFAVDDGRGWLWDKNDPQDGKFTFIANYVLHCFWPIEKPRASALGTMAIKTLSEAYMLTGDKKYGFAAGAMYYRMALIYPTLDAKECKWEEGFKLAHGHTKIGRAGGCIWDVELMNEAVEWYDMLKPCLDDEFASYLAENPRLYIGDKPKSGKEIREAIEENMLLQIYPDMRSYVLHCNPGFPHEMLLKTAKVLGRDDLFEEYAKYLFEYVNRDWDHPINYDLESLILTQMNRDGFAGEVSPSYNEMWTLGFIQVAEILKGHPKYDLYKNINFRKLGNMVVNYITADKFTLKLADIAGCGKPGIRITPDEQVKFFLETGNPKIAELLVKVCGDGPICKDWYIDCAEADARIRRSVKKEFRSESRLFPCFGLAMFESHPRDKDAESVGIYFGSNQGHGHRDTMNLYLHGFGIDMMPDLGEPSFKDKNPERYRWSSNAISHNTVTVKQEKPFEKELDYQDYPDFLNAIAGGQINHYYTDGVLSLIDVQAPKLYNKPFGRTLVVVDADGKSRYILDLFRVGEGEKHISYHAIGTETEVSGAEFIPQAGGTYAGENIPYADAEYTRRWYDGFNYLTDVSRCKNPKSFTVDWKCMDNWNVWKEPRNVHLKLHMLAGFDEAALCTGEPPKAHAGNPKAMRYLVAKKSGVATEFASVIEPYENESFISSCTVSQSSDVTEISVIHKNGREDRVIINRNGASASFLSVECRKNSEVLYQNKYGQKIIGGKVVSFTDVLTDKNEITVELSEKIDASVLSERFINIETEYEPNAFYEIMSATVSVDGKYVLDVGDCTCVTGYIDRDDKSRGYTYSFEKGAGLMIVI